jgi:chromosomal replication initiation ATPase DnaA
MRTHPKDLDLAAFIIQIICHEFRLGIDELESPERTERVTWPRWLAIYLTAKYTHMSWPVIGELFNRTCGSVRHTIQRSVPARIQTEPASRNKLFQLESYILDHLRRPTSPIPPL